MVGSLTKLWYINLHLFLGFLFVFVLFVLFVFVLFVFVLFVCLDFLNKVYYPRNSNNKHGYIM